LIFFIFLWMEIRSSCLLYIVCVFFYIYISRYVRVLIIVDKGDVIAPLASKSAFSFPLKSVCNGTHTNSMMFFILIMILCISCIILALRRRSESR